MSRTRRFMGGVSVGYVHQAVVTLVGLWLTPFLLWRLGPQDYGLWLTASQVIAYLTLLDIGVLALLPRDTAYVTGRPDATDTDAELSHIIGRTVRVVLWQMPFIALAAWAVWWALPSGWAPLRVPLAALLAAFVLTYPLRIFQATLQGLQDLAFVGSVVLAAWSLGTIVSFYLVMTGWGLGAMAVGAIITQVSSLGAFWYRMGTRFAVVLPRSVPRVGVREGLEYLRRGFWVSVSQIAQVLLYATDLLIVSWIFGPATVVPYACTQKLISVLSNQPQILSQAAAPGLSELRMGATPGKLLAVTSSLSLALMLGSGAVLVVVLGVNRAFVSWWVGADQYGGAVLTALFAAAMVIRHWNTALVYSLFSFGHERRISITTVIDGLVTLALSVIFAKSIGVAGVPLAFLAGALLVSVPANVIALARETQVSPLQFVSSLTPWAVRLALLLPVAAFANLLVRSPSLLSVASVAAGMGLLYTGIMLPLLMRPPLGEYVRRAISPVTSFFGVRPAPQPALGTSEQGPLV